MESEIQQLMALKDQLILYFVTNGMKWAIAILIVVAGFYLAKKVGGLILFLHV